jgi:hypothetical protein
VERLVLHLGLHKTGTTAAQRYLESKSEWMRSQGIQYVSIGTMRSEVIPLLIDLQEWKRRASRRFFESITLPTLVLSDENILGGTADVTRGEFYPWARNRIESLIDSLQGKAVHVIVCLRDPVDYFPAMYSEYLRHHEFLSFETYVEKFSLDTFSFWDEFRWFKTLPSNVKVDIVPFEVSLGGGVVAVVGTILRAAGGGAEIEVGALGAARRSFSKEEIDLATMVAERSNARVARSLLESVERQGGRFGETPFRPIERSVAAGLRKRYADALLLFGIPLL